MVQPHLSSPPEAGAVITKAVLRAVDALGLTKAQLAVILGVSAASVSRLGRGRTVDADSKEAELALLLLRVYRSLNALVGGDEDAAKKWLHGENHHLSAVPAELIETVAGLVHVAEYLDALRGRQ